MEEEQNDGTGNEESHLGLDSTYGLSDTLVLPRPLATINETNDVVIKTDSTMKPIDKDGVKVSLSNQLSSITLPSIDDVNSFLTPARSTKKELQNRQDRKIMDSAKQLVEPIVMASKFDDMLRFMHAKQKADSEALQLRDREFADLNSSITQSFQHLNGRIDEMNNYGRVDETHKISSHQDEGLALERTRQVAMDHNVAMSINDQQFQPSESFGQDSTVPRGRPLYRYTPYTNPNNYNAYGHPSAGNSYNESKYQAQPQAQSSEPIGNLSFLFSQNHRPAHTQARDYGNDYDNYQHAFAPSPAFASGVDSKVNNHGLCRLQSPHNLLTVFQKSSRVRMITTNSHTFPEWYAYMKALFTSCYLGCLNQMSPHLVPIDTLGWQLIEAMPECRKSCEDAIIQLRSGVLPIAAQGMSIPHLSGIFAAIVLAWPSMILAINSVLSSSIDNISLGHVKNHDKVDSYTVRITYFLVINNFIMSNDNAKAIRLKAFLNKSEYRPSESPLAFATRVQHEQRDINILFGEPVISQAMLKETFLEAVRRKTDKMYENILDHIEGESIGFTDLVNKLQNKYMREKARTVTEQLYSATSGPESKVDASANIANHNIVNDSANYSTSKQVPIKRDKMSYDLPCFQMRDKGVCDFL